MFNQIWEAIGMVDRIKYKVFDSNTFETLLVDSNSKKITLRYFIDEIDKIIFDLKTFSLFKN